MKYLSLFALFAAIVMSVCTASPATAEEPLNLLFFGNSFTSMYEIPLWVGNFAVADGHVRPNIIVDHQSGEALDFHTNEVLTNPQNNVDHSAIAGDTWDFVVMQGHSDEATHVRNPEFESDALDLYRAVESDASGHGNGVTGVMYQTWAKHISVPSSFPTLDAMQAEITAGYAGAADLITADPGTSGGPCRIATVGQAFQNEGFTLDIYDGYHQNQKGAMVAAMVIYRTIYNEVVSDLPPSASNLSEADLDDAIAIANSAPIVVPLTWVVHGDANDDGVVDLQDFGILKHHFGTSSGATVSEGDFDGDGAVTLDDFNILKDNFAAGGQIIPEPATLALLGVGVMLLKLRRKS